MISDNWRILIPAFQRLNKHEVQISVLPEIGWALGVFYIRVALLTGGLFVGRRLLNNKIR
jgi:hypothetical protein